MCGIVGYVGGRQASDVLLGGLARLEYRGYDSSGIAVVNGQGLKIVKAAGEKGLSPRALADSVVVHFQDLWKLLNISHDDFIRTSEPSAVPKSLIPTETPASRREPPSRWNSSAGMRKAPSPSASSDGATRHATSRS